MATIEIRRELDPQFNGWSGFGNTWYYGAYQSGKTGGYYGNGPNGSVVALFKFQVPSQIPASATITAITLNVSGFAKSQSYSQSIARFAGKITSPDTPQGWLNRNDYLGTSSSTTAGTLNASYSWLTYHFTNLSVPVSSLNALYFYCYSTSSSSLIEYQYTAWSPYVTIEYTIANPIAPKTITRSITYSGFYSSDQSYTATSDTAGYYFVTTDNPSSSSATWYKRATSTQNSTSCSFIVYKDTDTTSLYKTYYLTVIPNYNSQTYVGASSNYKTFYAPRFALQVYNNSTSPIEINSSDYSNLPNFGTILDGYVHQGYSSSLTSTVCDQLPGYSWSVTYDGKTRYAVYKRPKNVQTVSFHANGGSISSAQAVKTTSEGWIYGKGATSGGGNPTYTNSYLEPTRSGYAFLGWSKTSTGSVAYNNAREALDDGYTNTLYAVWEPEWIIKINNGTSWNNYHVWIYTGVSSNSGWRQAIPYVYDGSNWKITKI